MDELKTCPKCNETLLKLGGFYKSGSTYDGFTSYCRECIKAESRTRRVAMSPEQRHAKDRHDYERCRSDPARRAKLAEFQRRWWKAHPDKTREYHRQGALRRKAFDPEYRRIHTAIRNNDRRAKRLGLPSNFHWYDWLHVLEFFGNACAYCGATSALLDLEHVDAIRKVGGGGNILGNIVPACRPCNGQKSGKTLEQFCAERRLDATVIRARVLASRG
jgi:HNH endonuclease.